MTDRSSSTTLPEERLSAEERAERLLARAQWKREEAKHGVTRWWHHLRFLAFLVYLVLAVTSFWLWLLTAVVAVLRAGMYLVGSILAWFGGGGWYAVRGKGVAAVLFGWIKSVWTDRVRYYRILARPLARAYLAVHRGVATFWYWGVAHKLAAVIAIFWLICVPFLYIIPRPHYVQIIDDNVIEHHNAPNDVVRYVIHAVDLFEPGQRHEYINERAAHLGKVDPQGLKNEIVNGGYYKLWVIGIRWYWLPTLFPNIISATPVDAQGRTLEEPQGLLPPPSMSPWYQGTDGPFYPWQQQPFGEQGAGAEPERGQPLGRR